MLKRRGGSRMLAQFPKRSSKGLGDADDEEDGSYSDYYDRNERRAERRSQDSFGDDNHTNVERISFDSLKDALRMNRERSGNEEDAPTRLRREDEPMKSRKRRLQKIDIKSMSVPAQKAFAEEHRLHSRSQVTKRPLSLPESLADEYAIPFITHEELARDEEFLNGGSALLAFDVGTSMIGMAFTPTQTRAAPLGVLKWKGKSVKKLALAIKGELMTKTYPIAAIVIGIQEEYALQSSRLYKIIKQCWEQERLMIPILFEDEYRTTQDALHYLKTNDGINFTELNSGSRNASLEKRKIDMISAQFILQRALNKIHDLSMFKKRTAQHVDDEIKVRTKTKILADHAVKVRDEHDEKIMHQYAKFNVLLDLVKEKKEMLKRKKRVVGSSKAKSASPRMAEESI